MTIVADPKYRRKYFANDGRLKMKPVTIEVQNGMGDSDEWQHFAYCRTPNGAARRIRDAMIYTRPDGPRGGQSGQIRVFYGQQQIDVPPGRAWNIALTAEFLAEHCAGLPRGCWHGGAPGAWVPAKPNDKSNQRGRNDD